MEDSKTQIPMAHGPSRITSKDGEEKESKLVMAPQPMELDPANGANSMETVTSKLPKPSSSTTNTLCSTTEPPAETPSPAET